MGREAVIYVHEQLQGPGVLGQALRQAGFTLDIRQREYRGEDVEAPLLVVMGGPMGVYEAERYGFLKEELRVLTERVRAGRPVLGICLGAQLLATAAGSRVYRGAPGFELGVLPVQWNDAARADPVLAPVLAEGPLMDVVHWHGDTFDPVPGATLLASSPRYAWQAYRLGPSYGLQFHPELTLEMLLDWVRTGPRDLERGGVSFEQFSWEHVPRFGQAYERMGRLCDALARHFRALT